MVPLGPRRQALDQLPAIISVVEDGGSKGAAEARRVVSSGFREDWVEERRAEGRIDGEAQRRGAPGFSPEAVEGGKGE